MTFNSTPLPFLPVFIFSAGVVTEEVLHSRYLAHVKRESRSYVNQVLKEEKEIDQEEEDGDNARLVEQELEESSIQEKQQWTEEMREQLWAEKIHVEEKLRCIQDEHFYELLQVFSRMKTIALQLSNSHLLFLIINDPYELL